MMTSADIRRNFLQFFEQKGHKIVPSAPLVNKTDPTLMFVNSGMAPFKDYFLGNQEPSAPRIADTQKCLRVSGKHNDLDEVGRDGTHHTLFEMLGNWSFGDYFKKEAIAWSWELLTKVYKLPEDRLYATVFGGDANENLEPDNEALELWLQFLPKERILYGNKKDNFWEMGDTGPCGPCSEIHFDMRSDEARAAIPGQDLVNKDHPLVVEIWNNVFMQFNRKADRSLEPLPAKHVDTGMGFERLCMVLQGKTATYDTDVFTPIIHYIEDFCKIPYTFSYADEAKSDMAMRVVADHIRAISFVIADGQLPSNTGAGYVIRRILRRAVRYYFSFLNIQDPFLHRLVPQLADIFKDVFPELKAQQDFVAKVILEEEKSFLRTLDKGLRRMEEIEVDSNKVIEGKIAFELYDTFGFPIDLTLLVAAEKGYTVDQVGFEQALQEQKTRSRAATTRTVGDWAELIDNPEVTFVGYDRLAVDGAQVIKYRTVELKGKPEYQVVLNITPFYPEGGGQVGDTGTMRFDEETVQVIDTRKENDLIIHVLNRLPENLSANVNTAVNASKRKNTENNHSATHLLHAALREVLGTHVQQKGSLVNDRYLRFDFSHFEKMSDEQIARVEAIVNAKIRENVSLEENRNMPIEAAKAAGAMMLFGEKYGESVRMITFDPAYSRELCGGCHVKSTGQIGFFKITSEAAIAAGVRRVEAVTAESAEHFIQDAFVQLGQVKEVLKNPKDLAAAISGLQEQLKTSQKEIEKLYLLQAKLAKASLLQQVENINGINFYAAEVEIDSAEALKQLATDLRKEEAAFIVLGASIGGKANLVVAINDDLMQAKGFNAGQIVKEIAKNVQGGGGGQNFLATAGGTKPEGIPAAIEAAKASLS